MTKFKKDDKVIIVSKTVPSAMPLSRFMSWEDRKSRKYFVVQEIKGNGKGYDEWNCISIEGCYFTPSDLLPYSDEMEKMFNDVIDNL